MIRYHLKTPPDNNESERATRNVKAKQKISGQFKSDEGTGTFVILRSVIDTTIKSGQNVLQVLSLIAKLRLNSYKEISYIDLRLRHKFYFEK